MYSHAATTALAGGMTVGGLAMATNGGSGATVVGLLAAVIAVLLGYRSRRIRRAARAEPS